MTVRINFSLLRSIHTLSLGFRNWNEEIKALNKYNYFDDVFIYLHSLPLSLSLAMMQRLKLKGLFHSLNSETDNCSQIAFLCACSSSLIQFESQISCWEIKLRNRTKSKWKLMEIPNSTREKRLTLPNICRLPVKSWWFQLIELVTAWSAWHTLNQMRMQKLKFALREKLIHSNESQTLHFKEFVLVVSQKYFRINSNSRLVM